MENKKCFKCEKVKPINSFYKHPRMGDGHLNKCIECTKKDVRERESLLRETDPDFIQRERKRGREKYFRLDYREKYKKLPKTRKKGMSRKESTSAFRLRYPEKYQATIRSQRIKSPEGKQKHHWSYNEEHYKDVIFLTLEEHSKLHRYMIYDQERYMYRDLEGVLLDTKEKHIAYFEKIKHLD